MPPYAGLVIDFESILIGHGCAPRLVIGSHTLFYHLNFDSVTLDNSNPDALAASLSDAVFGAKLSLIPRTSSTSYNGPSNVIRNNAINVEPDIFDAFNDLQKAIEEYKNKSDVGPFNLMSMFENFCHRVNQPGGDHNIRVAILVEHIDLPVVRAANEQ